MSLLLLIAIHKVAVQVLVNAEDFLLLSACSLIIKRPLLIQHVSFLRLRLLRLNLQLLLLDLLQREDVIPLGDFILLHSDLLLLTEVLALDVSLPELRVDHLLGVLVLEHLLLLHHLDLALVHGLDLVEVALDLAEFVSLLPEPPLELFVDINLTLRLLLSIQDPHPLPHPLPDLLGSLLYIRELLDVATFLRLEQHRQLLPAFVQFKYRVAPVLG